LRRGNKLTLAQYLRFRLGTEGGKTAWFNFFIRPFGASSFAQFWRLWNPVYGYFLYYYSYRPLARVMPRSGAMLSTFIACGFFLHDLPAWVFSRRILPPGATIAFFMFGVGAVASDRFKMDLSRQPVPVRAAINLIYLAGCVVAMLVIVLRLF
jgi:MBOAT, membrane-bound O-acyltransferase family